MSIEVLSPIVAAVASVGALIVSIISLVKSSKVSKLQQEIAALDARLKQYELESIEQDLAACVEARLIKEGKGRRLKIYNKGRGIATDIDFNVKNKDIAGLFQKDKTPFPRLQHHESYEEVVIVYMGFPATIEIETCWNDERGIAHSKTNYVTV